MVSEEYKNNLNKVQRYESLNHPVLAMVDYCHMVVEVLWVLTTIGAFIYDWDQKWWLFLGTGAIWFLSLVFTTYYEIPWVLEWIKKDEQILADSKINP